MNHHDHAQLPSLTTMVFCVILALGFFTTYSQVPFTRGTNLTGWFQASSPRQIQFSKYSKTDLENIKSLGCDVIRLPINLHAMTSGSPEYIPDPLFLNFLDQVVSWAEELRLHIILDNHTFDPAANTDPAIEQALVKVWTHMAHHYKDRSEFIHYEVLNEPHGIDDAIWNAIQQNVINAIRAEDTEHFILVGAANWNSYHNLRNVPSYSDPKLIYTFHFYDPFVFTHQGASWTNPSMVPLAKIPFPYSPSRMPSTPGPLKGTWIERAIKNYPIDGTATRVRQLIDIAVAFKQDRGANVFCGEFGVYIPNSPAADRIQWYKLVREYLEQNGIPWTIWDYQGGFGLFDKNSPEYFNHDLNTEMLDALDLFIPPQSEYVKVPLRSGFTLYEDGFGSDITNASVESEGILDFYSSFNPVKGDYCIYWTGVDQYDPIGFDFNRNLDLTLLKANGYTLDFNVRTTSAPQKFDVRFIDSKDGALDRPWRMGMTIEGVQPDGEWHHVSILLGDLQEKGAWDGAWFPPSGSHFDWRSVDRFEIVPEHQSLDGIEMWFDRIHVTGEDIIVSADDAKNQKTLLSVYPNPVSSNHSEVTFEVPCSGRVSVSLCNVMGTQIRTLADGEYPEGVHTVLLEHRALQSGVYLVMYKTGISAHAVKVVVAN